MASASIPNEIMQILRDRELTPSKRLLAYAMLVPELPGDPAHELMCQANLELGKRIKELINNGTIEITGMDKHSVLNIAQHGKFVPPGTSSRGAAWYDVSLQ
tara:strand:+ start:333 stop:638 length:306 start_codon:yes stop_codon:yes gene_type:complete